MSDGDSLGFAMRCGFGLGPDDADPTALFRAKVKADAAEVDEDATGGSSKQNVFELLHDIELGSNCRSLVAFDPKKPADDDDEKYQLAISTFEL